MRRPVCRSFLRTGDRYPETFAPAVSGIHPHGVTKMKPVLVDSQGVDWADCSGSTADAAGSGSCDAGRPVAEGDSSVRRVTFSAALSVTRMQDQ